MSKAKMGAHFDSQMNKLADRVSRTSKRTERILIVGIVLLALIAIAWTPVSNWATLQGRSSDVEQVQVVSKMTGEVVATVTDSKVGAARFADDRVNLSSGSGWRLDTEDAVLFATEGTRFDAPATAQGDPADTVRKMSDDLKKHGAKYAVVIHQDGYIFGVYAESETPTKTVTSKGQTVMVFKHADDGQAKRIGVVDLNYEVIPLSIL